MSVHGPKSSNQHLKSQNIMVEPCQKRQQTNKQQIKKVRNCDSQTNKQAERKKIFKNKLKNGISSGSSKGWLFVHCVQIELEFRNAGRGREPTTKSTHI